MDVVKGGPAERAGLKKNDIITRYGDMEITDSSELQNSVAATPAGRDVKLMILRDGRQQELTARIGRLEDSTKLLGVIRQRAYRRRGHAPSRPRKPRSTALKSRRAWSSAGLTPGVHLQRQDWKSPTSSWRSGIERSMELTPLSGSSMPCRPVRRSPSRSWITGMAISGPSG